MKKIIGWILITSPFFCIACMIISIEINEIGIVGLIKLLVYGLLTMLALMGILALGAYLIEGDNS